MAHGGGGFKLPDLPNSAALRVVESKLVKPSTFRGGNKEVSLQTRMFEFYDSVLKEVERLALTGQDEATVQNVKKITGKLLIPTALRKKMTPEMFSSKAKELVVFLERIQFKEPIILQPPPT